MTKAAVAAPNSFSTAIHPVQQGAVAQVKQDQGFGSPYTQYVQYPASQLAHSGMAPQMMVATGAGPQQGQQMVQMLSPHGQQMQVLDHFHWV